MWSNHLYLLKRKDSHLNIEFSITNGARFHLRGLTLISVQLNLHLLVLKIRKLLFIFF